jgi:DNA repair photolyase
MSVIYVPAGKAREYAPLAANLYSGCNHGCKYCYCPNIFYKTKQQFHDMLIPRRNILRDFEKDCRKYTRSLLPVQFSFTTDPYNRLENELRLTREALKLCLKYQIPVSILTKSKTVLEDIDIIQKFGPHIKVGFTLTFSGQEESLQYEPEASLPEERLAALAKLSYLGVKTWASFEPVIIPEQSLELIKTTAEMKLVDFSKIGKVNYFKPPNPINWPEFLSAAIQILRSAGRQFYIKKDLRELCPEVELKKSETEYADDFLIKPF